MLITIKVTPRASKFEMKKMSDGTYKAWLKSSPVDGKANEELIKLVSTNFDVPKSMINIKKGKTGKNKIVEINNK